MLLGLVSANAMSSRQYLSNSLLSGTDLRKCTKSRYVCHITKDLRDLVDRQDLFEFLERLSCFAFGISFDNGSESSNMLVPVTGLRH